VGGVGFCASIRLAKAHWPSWYVQFNGGMMHSARLALIHFALTAMSPKPHIISPTEKRESKKRTTEKRSGTLYDDVGGAILFALTILFIAICPLSKTFAQDRQCIVSFVAIVTLTIVVR